jgi:DNA-binding NtrC family response regulator/tetratricopeptide (TPR) repeat protein
MGRVPRVSLPATCDSESLVRLDLGSRYEFLRELGRGGNGRVLLVRDTHLEREVALKLLRLPPAGAADLERFQKEFTLLTRLDHPGIAKAHDFGYLRGQPYFTCEHIPGEPLSRNGAPRDAGWLLEIASALAGALAFLHRQGILHLDVKPSNVLLRGGSEPKAVLIDFGLFRRGITPSAGGRLKGSLPYMAPEHFRGGLLGPWTDVYALGVTLYWLASGSLPRQIRKPGAGGAAGPDVASPPPSLSALRPSFPAPLESIISKCLAVDPALRFQNGGELLAALGRLSGTAPASLGAAGAGHPLIGRNVELARCDDLLDGLAAASRGEGCAPLPAALLVTAPPGMGQSRFLQEVKLRAQLRGITCYLERAYPDEACAPGRLLRGFGAHLPAAGAKPRSRWEAFVRQLGKPRRSRRSETLDEERKLRRAGEVALAARAIDRPLLIVADGLQHFDEVSLELLFELLRFLGEASPAERPPLGILAGFREEGRLARLLREIGRYLFVERKGEVIALPPLEPSQALELYRQRGGCLAEESWLEVFQRTGGSPWRIAALAARAAPEEGPSAEAARRRAKMEQKMQLAPARDAERLLLLLGLLRRPSAAEELADLAGLPRRRVQALLEELEAAKAAAVEREGGAGRWTLEPPAVALLEGASPSLLARLHRRIARGLVRRAAGADGPLRVEAALHFQRAGDERGFIRHGRRAASYLKSTFQYRAALDLLRAVLEALPSGRSGMRLEVVSEMAELMARAGSIDEGIALLREGVEASRSAAGESRAKLLLRLATLYSRSGNFQRAESLFREVFDGKLEAKLARADRLFFLAEFAYMRSIIGAHEEAEKLSRRGLRLAGRSRSIEVREQLLSFHATLANVAARTFRYDRAIEHLGKSIQIAEAIGSPSNQAVVLNNLGIVYGNCDRYRDALAAFREAERITVRLDEGPSLLSIHANLAVLHSKRGEHAAMEKSLAEAEKLAPEALGRRQASFLRHARGLCLVYRGRYGEARPHLESAVRLAGESGDRLLQAFDEVYLAEALLLAGAYSEASAVLRRLVDAEGPPRTRKMALARLALLEAVMGRPERVEEVAAKHAGVAANPPIAFLEAWDDFWLGWGFSLAAVESEDEGRKAALFERSLERTRRAHGYFSRHGLAPGASLALWVQAEAAFLGSDVPRARELLQSTELKANDLAAALKPLLSARLLLEANEGTDSPARAGDLLAEAGAALAGGGLIEWECRLAALRAALAGGGAEREEVERRRREIAKTLPDAARRPWLESRHWRRWSELPAAAGRQMPRGRPALGEAERIASSTRTLLLSGRGGAADRRELAARSPAMRRLTALLDRIRASELPVLIEGETGSGKEMVARLIHAESRRARRPFVVLDCASLPVPLLEAELFGARAGAFTGAAEDREGLFAAAEGGTVLLDEVGSLALEAQAKLLRALTSRSFRRLGDERETRLDVRFLASTSARLEELAAAGSFRSDLLHRLRVLAVRVPPLRERLADLPLLVKRFLAEQGAAPALGKGVIERLSRLSWPGNVRELRNVILRLSLEGPEQITLEALESLLAGAAAEAAFPESLLTGGSLAALKDKLEARYIRYHLERLGGDTGALSRFLGIRRQQLYRRARRLGIALGRRRPNARG